MDSDTAGSELEKYDQTLLSFLQVIWCDLLGRDWTSYIRANLQPHTILDCIETSLTDHFMTRIHLPRRFNCIELMDLYLQLPTVFHRIRSATCASEIKSLKDSCVSTWLAQGLIEIKPHIKASLR